MGKIVKKIGLIIFLCVFISSPFFSEETEPVPETDTPAEDVKPTESESTEEEKPETTPEEEPAESDSAKFSFNFGLGFSVESFNEGSDEIIYQGLTIAPEFVFGKFAVCFDFTLHYRFTGGSGHSFEVRKKDWVPDSAKGILPLYLPKIAYIRYGEKGEDIYLKLGSIDDAILGNGFIMGGYSNMLFLPEERIFGLTFDLDGKLFNFPYLGFETFMGNLGHFDIVGGRLYVRPLAAIDSKVMKELQIGFTTAADIDPYYHRDNLSNDAAHVVMMGADARLPIVDNKSISFAVFGDYVNQQFKYHGGMIGVGGQIIKHVNYGFQLRFLGDNFVPVYFDESYDLFRVEKYDIVSGNTEYPNSIAWQALLGFSVLKDALSLNITIDGPFKAPNSDRDNYLNYPHLRADFILAEGLIPYFSFNAYYDKKLIRKWGDLVSAENAIIGTALNYQTGPAVITLYYNLRYNPEKPGSNKWEITSGIKSAIKISTGRRSGKDKPAGEEK